MNQAEIIEFVKAYWEEMGANSTVNDHNLTMGLIFALKQIEQEANNMKKCKGTRTVSFPDPYYSGETYSEEVECYCDECVKPQNQEVQE